MVSSLPGQSVGLCGQPSQVASCLFHSAGIEKSSSAGVDSVAIFCSGITRVEHRSFCQAVQLALANAAAEKLTRLVIWRLFVEANLSGWELPRAHPWQIRERLQGFERLVG